MKNTIYLFTFILFSKLTFGQNKTKIITTDIDNFWMAYDSVKSTKDTSKQLQFVQKLYFEKATVGFKDFIELREFTAREHLENILLYPKFWESIRSKTLDIKQNVAEIEEIFKKYKVLYPDFIEPSVYFTIGNLNSGGTVSSNRILIGSEISCADKTTDASELSNWLKNVFKLNTSVISMVAHEIGHTQQKIEERDNENKSNVLANTLAEGMCDFLAELVYKPISQPYTIYGNKNEYEIWLKFKQEMYGEELVNWLYNGSEAPNGNADLGYFVGAQICKSYYTYAKDKKKAIKTIIELKNNPKELEKFLKKSKYNGGLKN